MSNIKCYLCRTTEDNWWGAMSIGGYTVDVCRTCLNHTWYYLQAVHEHAKKELDDV